MGVTSSLESPSHFCLLQSHGAPALYSFLPSKVLQTPGHPKEEERKSNGMQGVREGVRKKEVALLCTVCSKPPAIYVVYPLSLTSNRTVLLSKTLCGLWSSQLLTQTFRHGGQSSSCPGSLKSLCSQGWPWTCAVPVSASGVLGLQTCACTCFIQCWRLEPRLCVCYTACTLFCS